MNRWLKYEKKYLKLHSWVFIWLGAYILIYRFAYEKWPFWLFIGTLSLYILHIEKKHLLYLKTSQIEKTYDFCRIIELFIMSFFITYQGQHYVGGSVLYLLYILEIIMGDAKIRPFWNYGFYSIPFVFSSLLATVLNFNTSFRVDKIIHMFFFIIIFLTFSYILNWYAQEFKIQLQKNKWLWEQTEEQNQKLLETQKHMQQVNQELEAQKKELQHMNEKFRKSIAEFYILKEIGNYIGAVLELEQLLDMITDIIMGIMGVDTCSIVLWDDEKKEMTFQINSIYPQNIIEKFKSHAKNEQLIKLMKDSSSYVENFVVSGENKYSFLEGRKVGSFIAVPLSKNNKAYGIILVEHQLESYFSESSIEFFKAVSAQIVIAIENATLYKKMEEMASKDGLTEVYNRTYLRQIIPKMFKWAKEHKKPLSVAIFDIDSFKKVNDSYGHLFGDKVLQIVAYLGKKKIEQYGGIIGRYGGEEFLLLLPGSNLYEMANIVEELRQEIAQFPIQEGKTVIHIQASFGVSAYPEIALNSTELIQTADYAMYRSKQLGKNQVTIATKEYLSTKEGIF